MRVKTKTVKVPLGAKDEGTAAMFNQMLGSDNINLEIAYPRYIRIKNICENLLRTLQILTSAQVLRLEILIPSLDEIQKFHDACEADFRDIFDVDLTDFAWNFHLVEENIREKFQSKYSKMKASDKILSFITTRHILVIHRTSLIDVSALKPAFITTMSSFWRPFSFSNLDLVDVFAHITEPSVRNIFLLALNKILLLSDRMFNELQSPDFEISTFINAIMTNIDKVKHVPELSRCDKAFAKVKESVGLLQKNFNDYYRDFVKTKSTTTIMENFISDVSFNTQADASTTRQFRILINYYHKLSQQKSDDMNPKVKHLFEKINESFSRLDHNGAEKIKITDKDDQVTDGPTVLAGAISVNDLLNESSDDEK